MAESFRTRERKDSKTAYGHFEYVIINANEVVLKRLLGNEFCNAIQVLRKGIKTEVLLQ